MERYQKAIDELFKKIRDTQTENIIKAGEMVSDSVASGGCIFLSSICHSMEMDSIYRGGGPIFYKHFSYSLNIENG
ncbi:MAG: SIS domain-containing protein, partial [Clostridiales bacterium]|nr:SIS domain-containing protein [Clostridiales bacterium]